MQASVWDKRIHEPFIAAALGIGLTTGFGYAALLTSAPVLKIPLGAWWGAAVQAHGHAQLFGWMGMFIVGMGLYFLPKLRGTRLRAVHLAAPAFVLLTIGILVRSLAQPALGFPGLPSAWTNVTRMLVAGSALAELAGVGLIAWMLISTVRAAGPLSSGAPAYPVLPFLLVAGASMGLAVVLNTLGVFGALYRFCATPGTPGFCATVPPAWDSLVIQVLLYGMALPVAFVFSVRNLPLYLRLAAPPRETFRLVASIYAFGLVLRLSPGLASIVILNIPWLDQIGALGVIVQAVIILIFIWLIDLVHHRPPWTVDRTPTPLLSVPEQKEAGSVRSAIPPTRKNYPDAGEFGRFELLIYSAFFWLSVAALLSVVRSISILLGQTALPLDAERHTLTVGFITLLIFGMAARMVPGFSHKRRVAFAPLVMTTFILGNAAVILRVIPLFLPATSFSTILLGLSGAVGWLAVAALAVNLWRTIRL